VFIIETPSAKQGVDFNASQELLSQLLTIESDGQAQQLKI